MRRGSHVSKRLARRPRRRRAKRSVALGVAVALVIAGPAYAGWLAGNTGLGGTAVKRLSAGNIPSPTVTGRNVALTWTASQLSDGGPNASGYVVKRYSTTNVLQSIGDGCAAVVAGLSCTEVAAPPGTWKYTITPRYVGWSGTEGPAATAVVGAPQLSVSPVVVAEGDLPETLTGSIANFIEGETLRFRLDNATSGTILTGTVGGSSTPTAIPGGGGAPVTVELPAGTPVGSHQIYAVAAESAEFASAPVTVAPPPPDVTEVIVASHPNNGKGRAKQNGNYYVYANITGVVDTATANVSSITAGAIAVGMQPCSSQCVIDGVTYGFKSVSPHLTTNGTLAQGSYGFSVTATNAAGSDTASNTLTIDNTAPTPGATSLVLKNNGASEGVPENGDTIEVTFTERLAVATLCANWANNEVNQSASLDVTIVDGTGGGPNDMIVFSNAGCGTFNFGTVDMGGKNFLQGGNMTFVGSVVTWNPTTLKVVITLQNKGGTASVNNANLTSTYNPNPAIQDLAGNGITGTANSPAGRQF